MSTLDLVKQLCYEYSQTKELLDRWVIGRLEAPLMKFSPGDMESLLKSKFPRVYDIS